jgi:hypothetical protein
MPIFVITGPPGAGKSTISSAVVRSRPLSVHLEADVAFHWVVNGFVPPWLPGADRQNITVIRAVGAAAAQYAAGGYDVVVDGIIGPWLLAPFVEALGAETGDVRYAVLRPTRQIAMERALGRTGDRDLVDPVPISAMYDAFERLGPFEDHVFDTSDDDLEVTVQLLLDRLNAGAFVLG